MQSLKKIRCLTKQLHQKLKSAKEASKDDKDEISLLKQDLQSKLEMKLGKFKEDTWNGNQKIQEERKLWLKVIKKFDMHESKEVSVP